jgi:hypothetical protein
MISTGCQTQFQLLLTEFNLNLNPTHRPGVMIYAIL